MSEHVEQKVYRLLSSVVTVRWSGSPASPSFVMSLPLVLDRIMSREWRDGQRMLTRRCCTVAPSMHVALPSKLWPVD